MRFGARDYSHVLFEQVRIGHGFCLVCRCTAYIGGGEGGKKPRRGHFEAVDGCGVEGFAREELCSAKEFRSLGLPWWTGCRECRGR